MKACEMVVERERYVVMVERDRYDELLRKEAMLDTVERLSSNMSEYTFRDAIRFILKYEKMAVNADE